MSEVNDLKNEGYRRTESDCHEDDCEGQLWYDDHTLVCSECYLTIDLDRQRRQLTLGEVPDLYDGSVDPPTYNNSGRVRLPGGFPIYEWINSDDIEGTVRDLEPENFYRS